MKINFDSIKEKFEEKAYVIYSDNDKLKRLLKAVKEIVEDNKQLMKIWDDLKLMLNLLKDWLKGDYKDLSRNSAIMIIISFLYLISPLDLIPDFLFGGFIDDIAVLGFVFKKLSEEIGKYKEWKDLGNNYKTDDSEDSFIEINLNQDDNIIDIDYDAYKS